VSAVARQLKISPRSLQRRLRGQGTSYQALLDDVRRELALRYLDEPCVSVTEVAFLVGFTEPSAFHRAFKRRTGTTPAEARRRGAGIGAAARAGMSALGRPRASDIYRDRDCQRGVNRPSR